VLATVGILRIMAQWQQQQAKMHNCVAIFINNKFERHQEIFLDLQLLIGTATVERRKILKKEESAWMGALRDGLSPKQLESCMIMTELRNLQCLKVSKCTNLHVFVCSRFPGRCCEACANALQTIYCTSLLENSKNPMTKLMSNSPCPSRT